MFGQGKYTDRDGETHRVKDIPDFGRRGGTPRVPGYVAATDARVAHKKYQAQLKAEKERAQKQAEARRRKALQDQLKAEAKAAKKAAKKAKREGK